jgi:zinc transporter ZupT
VLAGVAVFWLLPEIAEVLGWVMAVGCVAMGIVILALINRFVYPVCPSCAGPHDHDHCAQSLHGFAAPLVLAASLHALLDGWSLSASGESNVHLSSAFGWAIGIHKIPEGIALGVILRAALPRWGPAAAYLAFAQLCTLLGAGIEWMFAPQMSPQLLHMLLALAGGSFLYLSGHAIHGEWRQRGLGQAFVPALAGLASPSVLRLFRLI